jgi:type I restriction enzyme S subunit
MNLPPYPKYKPSGVEWLGDVPEHWEVKRGRFCMRVNPITGKWQDLASEVEVSFVSMDAIGEFGGLRLDVSRPLEDIGSGYTAFEDGDVVVAKITPCFENGKGALAEGLVNSVAFGTTELHVLRVYPVLASRFLFYLTLSTGYRKTGEAEMYGAGGQKRVPPEFNKDFRTPLPSIEEQQAIADFLDERTGKLDALAEKKRDLIEKLKEKRSALISRTVTKGLPLEAAAQAGLPTLPKLKPSGIDWLGDIPEHWDAVPMKYAATIGNGSTPNRDNAAYWEGEHAWLNSSVVNQEAANEADQFVTDLALRECHLPWIKPPAVLVGITGEGRTRGMATTLKIEATINQHVAFLKPHGDRATVQYLRRVMDTAYDLLRSESEGGGSTKGAITCSQLSNTDIPLPPIPEQTVIADYLDRETAKIDRMIEKVEAALEKLAEYRTALISAAVTGKICVTN